MAEYTFDTAQPVELVVRVGSSDVTVDAGDSRTTVVSIVPRDDDPATLADVERVRVGFDGTRVAVSDPRQLGGRRRRGGGYDIRIELPATSSADIAVGSGTVETRGALGALQVKSGSGDVRIDSCGPARVLTGSGDVEIGAALDGAEVKSGSGDAVVRSAHAGSFEFMTGSGDVRCGIPEGVAARLDVKSGMGDIFSRLSGSDDRPEAASYITVQAKTGSGDVVIERALAPA
ncbi:MAG: hypothetical protein JWM98_1987 [Thermoleophilia bacterium]|nr:hypothetical protein [Thermoleophilia bacterium]